MKNNLAQSQNAFSDQITKNKHFANGNILKMKFFILFCLLFFLNCQNHSHSVDFEYLDSETFGQINFLYFNITNNTTDTIYLSSRNIKLSVIKGNKFLKNEEIKTRGQLIFDRSNKNKERENIWLAEEEKTDLLKDTFATNLFYKNFGKNKYKNSKEFVIRCIKADCIILKPKQTFIYSKIFNNSAFDSKCKVNISYPNTKRFSYFVDDTGKEVEINN